MNISNLTISNVKISYPPRTQESFNRRQESFNPQKEHLAFIKFQDAVQAEQRNLPTTRETIVIGGGGSLSSNERTMQFYATVQVFPDEKDKERGTMVPYLEDRYQQVFLSLTKYEPTSIEFTPLYQIQNLPTT